VEALALWSNGWECFAISLVNENSVRGISGDVDIASLWIDNDTAMSRAYVFAIWQLAPVWHGFVRPYPIACADWGYDVFAWLDMVIWMSVGQEGEEGEKCNFQFHSVGNKSAQVSGAIPLSINHL
jgi:hypothetical protein